MSIFFGNLIFTLIARTFSGNCLKTLQSLGRLNYNKLDNNSQKIYTVMTKILVECEMKYRLPLASNLHVKYPVLWERAAPNHTTPGDSKLCPHAVAVNYYFEFTWIVNSLK